MQYLRLGTKGFVFAILLSGLSGLMPLHTVEAVILVDDFTTTSDPGIYPIVKPAEFPTLIDTQSDPLGITLGSASLGRVLTYAPILTTEQAISGVFDGSQTISLDTTAGRLTSTSVGDGAPLLLTLWTSDTLTEQLDLDVSSEAGLRVDYESSAAVDARLLITNTADDDGNDIAGGNEAIVTFQPGTHSIFIPFSEINIVLTELDFSTGPPFSRIDLPLLDLTSVDQIGFLINPVEDATIPEGLILSLDYVAFVPEPTAALLIGVGLLMTGVRRRS